jgi:uncharacterized protein
MSEDPIQASPAFTPISPEERIAVLDVLRGFALLGILVMNMPAFNTPFSSWSLQPRLFPGPVDRAAMFVMELLVAGKANAIFSFLFGLGLTVQMQRADASGRGLAPVYLRRLAVLLVLGAAHGLLLWDGDVLHMYAVLGLLLLAVRRASDRLVLSIVALSLLAPLVRGGVALYFQETPRHPLPFWVQLAHEQMRIFQQGSYAEQVAARAFNVTEWYSGIRRVQGIFWVYVSFTVSMLLGFLVGRRRMLENVAANAAWIRKATGWCLGLGILTAAGFATLSAIREPVGRPTVGGFFTGLLFNVSRPLLCIAYVGAIALLCQRARFWRVAGPLASVGRMPLTNYLLQSVFGTTLFYSYGFGLFGKVGPALGLVITAAIFAVQVVYSRWWMARFRFGPLEWLWRGATYGKLPALRVEAGAGGAAAVISAA